jgi:hypothetical protein
MYDDARIDDYETCETGGNPTLARLTPGMADQDEGDAYDLLRPIEGLVLRWRYACSDITDNYEMDVDQVGVGHVRWSPEHYVQAFRQEGSWNYA